VTKSFQSRWQQFRQMPTHPEVSIFPNRKPRLSPKDAVDAPLEGKCPSCHYSLRGIEPRYCPECGLHVEFEPVIVFSAAEHALVAAAGMLMDQHRITNMIVMPEAFDALLGMLGRSKRMPHLMVPYKFLFEAAKLLEDRFGKRTFAAGEKPPRRESGTSWTCPGCNEENPGTFEICWSCGASPPQRGDPENA